MQGIEEHVPDGQSKQERAGAHECQRQRMVRYFFLGFLSHSDFSYSACATARE